MTAKIGPKIYSILNTPIYRVPKTKKTTFIKYLVCYLFLYYMYFMLAVMIIGVIFNPFSLTQTNIVTSRRSIAIEANTRWLYKSFFTFSLFFLPAFFAVKTAKKRLKRKIK